MIAGIDRQLDVSICFQKDEIESLSKGEQIAGILVRTYKPHEQGFITAQVDNSRKNLGELEIKIDDKNYWEVDDNFKLDIFIENKCFYSLQERGRIGIRQSSLRDGSTINLYNSDLDNFQIKTLVDELEFYRDNKEKLKEEYIKSSQ